MEGDSIDLGLGRKSDAPFPKMRLDESSRGEAPEVCDFLQKPFEPQVMIDAVQSALRLGQADSVGQRESTTSRLELLTPLELRIVRLIGEGKASKEIAQVLERSKRTVDYRRRMILSKTGAPTMAALVDELARRGGQGELPG